MRPQLDTQKGNRPSFSDAAAPDLARQLYERFCDELAATGVIVQRRVFGAWMQVVLPRRVSLPATI